jgi:TRAP-type C4-dicarboxylate transport system permease small subunit
MSNGLRGVEFGAERVIRAFSTTLNIISAVWVVTIAFIILYDVVGREFFDAPFYGTNEIVTNSILSILLLQLPLSILNRSSLRTTIVFDKVGFGARAGIDALSYTLAGLLFLAIAVGSWPNMVEAWEILEQEGSGIITIPVYPVRTLVIFVAVLGVFVCALLTYQSLARPRELHDPLSAPDGN